ncbi:MAG: CshA/CshB family fibrillar adhesin-related protein [Aeromicrobium sp.]|uniref:CshA/CshB family fibrillar adhesin-related protein n=1 Tax=Aeromicrobium sp. TaxID=1871063 RepID=UPI0039E38DE8
MKKTLAALAASALLGGGLVLATGVSAEARYADPATSEGRYVGEIDWFEWSDEAGASVTNGEKVNTREIDGKDLVTTCTISGFDDAEAWKAYRPGAWGRDTLDEMYNIGGVGNSNELISGLVPGVTEGGDGSVSCSVTYDGESVPLSGLVVGDAEENREGEWLQATAHGEGTWRLIDGYGKNNDGTSCETDVRYTRTAGPDSTMIMTGQGYPTACPDGAGPALVSFLDVGAGQTSVSMDFGTASGGSVLALGVVLPVDFGDAPVSYGEAGALYSPTFDGGVTPESTELDPTSDTSTWTHPTQPYTWTDVNPNADQPNAASYATATTDLRLGDGINGDSAYWDDAEADADTGDDGIDAAAVVGDNAIPTARGGSYALEVACTGGFVQGWIDWNADGAFDDGEGSGAFPCDAESVALTWDVPEDAVELYDGDVVESFMRLRVGADEAAVASATGLSTSGEVEDYAVDLGVDPTPGLELEKIAELQDANGNGYADAGETIDYSFVVSNTGNLSAYDVTVEDPKVTGITPASVTQLAPEGVDTDDPSYADAEIGEVTFTADPYVVTADDLTDGTVQNTATATGTIGGEEVSVSDTVETDGPPAEEATEAGILPTTGAKVGAAGLLLALVAAAVGTLVLRRQRRTAA